MYFLLTMERTTESQRYVSAASYDIKQETLTITTRIQPCLAHVSEISHTEH